MSILILVAVLFALIVLGVPIAWALGISGTVGLFILGGDPFTIVPQSIYSGVSYFPLMAIPFFFFAGELMNKGGITKRLIDLSSLLVGRVAGSLAYVNVVCSMFLGGITGSSVADVSSEGAWIIPAMKEQGYSSEEAVAVTVTSSIMGPIIPPSIIMVIYGSNMNVSVGALFMGGIIPGILVAASLALVVFLRNKKYGFPRRTEKYTPAQVRSILINAIIPLGMPIIIMGGILGGIFTATEAGAIACLYAVIASCFIMRTVKLSELPHMLLNTVKLTGTVLIILGCSKTLSWTLTLLRVQDGLAAFITSHINSGVAFLLIVNLLYLFLGCFMDPAAALLMFGPILAPIASRYGINPIHFGLISCINLTIGNATPPLGQSLFVGCKIGKVSVGREARAILPYLFGLVIVLFITTYIPEISLFLPRLAGLAG